jgi:hypothetical protein
MELPRLARLEWCCDTYIPTSERSACLTQASLGQPQAGSGGPTEIYAISDSARSDSDHTAPPAAGPAGTAGHGLATAELVGATGQGTTGRGFDRDRGPRVGCGFSAESTRLRRGTNRGRAAAGR